jgi:tRNA pseudouridine38-40 synthase
MPRYALVLEYDGAAFQGWQRQSNGPSVQQVLEEHAAALNGGEKAVAVAAGRTDSGVHALGQVAEITLSAELSPDKLRMALNFHLRPWPVVVRAAAMAPEGWSPRFSATQRAYRYRILNRSSRPALDAGRVWHIPHAMDAEAMDRAAAGLLGQHDFSAYRAASCQAASPVRTMELLRVRRERDEIIIEAEARSFLHHQVRNLAGTLAEVGKGRRPEAWPREVLESRDRAQAGQTAPPDGLCFMWVRYDAPPDWV